MPGRRVHELAGAIAAALFLQSMFGDLSAGGNYPIARPGGDWRSLVMEIVLTAILVSIGAAIAVVIIALVRGIPDKQERKAAEGGELPLAAG